MPRRISPAPFEGEPRREQTRQRRPAQGAQPAGRASLGHEVGRVPTAGVPGAHPTRRTETPDVRAVYSQSSGHQRGRRSGPGERHRRGRAVPSGIPGRPVARRIRDQLCPIQAAVLRSRTGIGIPRDGATGEVEGAELGDGSCPNQTACIITMTDVCLCTTVRILPLINLCSEKLRAHTHTFQKRQYVEWI